jgi:hypothetical protein
MRSPLFPHVCLVLLASLPSQFALSQGLVFGRHDLLPREKLPGAGLHRLDVGLHLALRPLRQYAWVHLASVLVLLLVMR